MAALESFLDTWAGTLIVVSHDRYFLERVTDHQYALIDQEIRHLPGGVDEYLRLAASLRTSPDIDTPQRSKQSDQPLNQSDKPSDVLSNKDRRAYKKEYDAVERKMCSLHEAHKQKSQALTAIDPTDYMALQQAQGHLDEIAQEIEELELRWLDLSERLGL